ncbi:MAG: hypothetical protein M3Q75_13440 [Gemmatimonadota bacterium]|nr:hypothetical protein [Gemmatimonadota bacterium]
MSFASAPKATPEKKALLEAFESVLTGQAEEHEAQRREAETRRLARTKVRPGVWLGAVIALFVSAYLWVEEPEWIFPAPPAPESVAVAEASLRIGLANAAQHIERFRQRTGRLPQTLSEAGAHGSGMTFELTGTHEWRLAAVNGPVRLSLASADELPKFLGNSFEVVSRRAR